MSEPTTLFVPVRSNASGLVAGSPVEALRRRLKLASLAFDRVLLEGGVLRVSAGPNGSSAFISSISVDDARFDTAHARRQARGQVFTVGFGVEESPGVPAEVLHNFIQSETSVSWTATLVPFARELPDECDWIDFVRSRDPDGELAKVARTWSTADARNSALRRELPVPFVRDLVIKQANRDLAIAVGEGSAVALDRLHQHVVLQRFDDPGWRPQGFAVPILFPQVAQLDWESIGRLRRTKQIDAFRKVMRDVEADAFAEASTGDIEAAAYHAYERYLAEAAGHIDGLSAPIRRGVAGLIIGGSTGLVTFGLTGPVGVFASAALGTGIGAVGDFTKVVRRRQRHGWVSVHQRLIRMS